VNPATPDTVEVSNADAPTASSPNHAALVAASSTTVAADEDA
jgi:hypothetical protein